MLRSTADGPAVEHLADDLGPAVDGTRWTWIDVRADVGDLTELLALTTRSELDGLAVRDAVEEDDLPKVDDFGSSLLVVLHGLADDRIRTYEIDCFLSERSLLTVHRDRSPALDVLWSEIQHRPELASGGADELLARLADVLTRRLFSVLDEFDDRIERLIMDALDAAPSTVADVTAVRSDLAMIRRSMHPQREVLDQLRGTPSTLLSDRGRRRFADVFDVASRATQGLEAARAALAETLDAYRGAVAHHGAEVSKVLTIYAAIMLPLSLVAGFFGMNFPNLPTTDKDWGWIVVSAAMLLVAVVSMGVFVAAGWIRRPSGREAGSTLGRGLAEAARTPAQLVGAAFEISTMPIRNLGGALLRQHDDDH